MRQIPLSESRSFGGERWLCRVRLTAADVAARHGVVFEPDEDLPGTVLAIVQVEGIRLLLSAVPEAQAPMTFVAVSACDEVRRPREAIDSALRALACSHDELESLSGDLQPWPWAVTEADDHGGRRVLTYRSDRESAEIVCDGLRRRGRGADLRVEAA